MHLEQEKDVRALDAPLSGELSKEEFLGRLTEHDLVLSNQTDDNALTTICGEIQVLYRRPESDPVLPPIPDSAYLCRYSMEFGEGAKERGKVDITPFTGEDDDWSEMSRHKAVPERI